MESLVSLRHGLAKGHALRTRSHRVCRILDVCAVDEGAVFGEDCCADVEIRVWAVGSRFRGYGARMKAMELHGGDTIRLADRSDIVLTGRGQLSDGHGGSTGTL